MQTPNIDVALSKTLRGHSGFIYRIKWSDDGNFLASPSADKTVKIWSKETGKLVQNLTGHRDEVNGIAWSPDGTRIASCSDDFQTIIWEVSTGRVLDTWTDHTDEVNDLAWSPDGNYLVSVSDDKKIVVRNLGEGSVHRKTGHGQAIWTASWSPDGEWLATGSDDETIRLWSIITDEVRILKGHKSTVRSLCWFSDSKRLVSGSRDNTVQLWDIRNPDVRLPLATHEAMVTSVSVSFDDRLVASKSNDGTVRLWDIDRNGQVAQIEEPKCIKWPISTAFHPARNLLATLGENSDVIRIWEISEDIFSKPIKQNSGAENGNVVFISYCHADKAWLQQLLTILEPLTKGARISIWSDTQLKVGSKWKDEINQALDECSVAILLVTPDFLASKFISEIELPYLLKKAYSNSLSIIWIPVRDSLYEESGLSEFQAGGDPSAPLESLKESEQNASLVRICRTIKDLLSATS